MSGNGEHLQVVFLIDTRSYNKSSALINNDKIGLTQALSLSALKILQSLVGLGGGGKGGGTEEPPRVRSVRWGYKFFDSLRPCSGYRHRDFHDFNLTNFEKFEDELRNKFKTKENESFSDGHSSKKQLKNPSALKVWSQDFAPADHLAVALCEVAQDFQWQAPDIMSPSRSTRSSSHSKGSSNSSSVNKSDKTNLTFLFMACPWNGDDLKDFVKMRSNQITTSDLLEVIVHDDVRTDFLEKHHVKLIWFDTRIVISHKLCKCNKAVLDVVQGMMRTINGHLIPLNAILSIGSQVTSSLSTILHSASVEKPKLTQTHSARKKGQPTSGSKSSDEKCVKKSANIFEHFNTVSNCMTVSSVMDYCCCKAHISKQNPCQVSEIITTLYVPKGANLDVFCCLKVTSLSANAYFRKITCVEKSSSELNKSTTSDCTNENESATELIDGINTVIKGSLPRDQIQLHCLNSKFVYSCLGLKPKPVQNATDQKGDDDNYEEQLSNSFSSLMERLARNNHILVLDVSHSEWLTSLVAIMEPLTTSVASLRLISPKSALNMQSIKTGICFSKETEKCHQRLMKRNENIEEEINPSGRAVEKKAVSYADLQELVVRQFHPYQLELWYKSAPSCGVNSEYVTQLTSIQGANNNSTSSSLRKAMMDLRDVYCKDPAVLGKSLLPFPNNNPLATKATSVVSNQAEHKMKLTRAKSFGGISASRTGIILENSKKLQKNKSNELVSKEEDGKKEPPAQKDKTDVNINEILAEFSSSDDMLKHLKDSYGNQLQQNSCPCLFAQTVVSIAKHFVKVQQNEKDTIEETKKLLKNCLVMSNKQLREKYQREDHQASVEERIREVVLQVVLQLEMEALSPTNILSSKCGEGFKKEGVLNTNVDDISSDGEEKENELPSCLQNIVDEMVAMLQTIPFLSDHNKLTMFLQDKLLPNYADTVPYMLVGIYEGLMQPLPSQLCSPNTEDLMSVQQPPLSSFGSVSSLDAAGSIPSNRPRGLKRLPSLANIQTRTITVDLKKNENKPKESGGMQVKKKPVVEEAKKVRRNLFMGDSLDDKVESKGNLSRRKSVAVMQTTKTWKSPRRTGRGCSRSGVILKTKTVKETPGKRQVLSAMLDKMERARQKQKVGSETHVQVVEESPVKPVHKTAGVRSSPRIKAASSLHGTKSFYSKSNNKHSRNLAKALNLGARIRGVEASMPSRRSRLAEHSSSIHDIQESKDSKISQESPSKFLFSEIFSPEKLQCIRKTPLLGSDSPSHNTRQKVSLTPIKQDAPQQPMLTASGVKKSLLFSPVKVQKDTITTECLSNDVQSGGLKSPFKSPIGTPLRTPRKRKCLSQSPLVTRSAEKSKQLEMSSIFAETQETNTKKDDVANKKPDTENKIHEFQSTPPLKNIESPSNGKQSRCRISPRAKSETLDYWPRKKVRSGTPSPIAYKTPPSSSKDRICTSPSQVWIESHQQSPKFHKVTPKSVGSSNKKVTPRSAHKHATENSTLFTRTNSRHKQQTVAVEDKLKKAPKSRRKLSISSQNQMSNIYCSFSSSAEDDDDGDFLPSADQLFTEDRFHNLVGLISNQGLDSDSDPEIDFPKQQIHLNQNDQIRKENLLTPSYGLRRKRSRDSCNSNEKPSKVSRKKTPDFRNTGSSFECYQQAAGPSTRLSAPEGFTSESCNNLHVPIGEILSTSLSASFRKPSRRMTQNMPSAASGGSAVSSCTNELSCSQFSNCSSFDGDEVFTEDSPAHESKDKGYRSPRGMHTPKCKHTPLSVRGLSQLLSSPLVSPSQKKSLGGNERTRFSRRGSSLASPK